MPTILMDICDECDLELPTSCLARVDGRVLCKRCRLMGLSRALREAPVALDEAWKFIRGETQP